MPILDGWGACKKILELFDNSRKLFNIQFILKSVDYMKNWKPLIYGVTGSNITPKLKQEAKSYGFITLYDKITTEII